MALATATITYDIADLTGVDFDSRRTKVWVTTNIPDGTIADTAGNQVRIGDGRGSLANDGTGSVTVWVPGAGSNPASWQTTLHVDYQPRSGGRTVRNFGPFTITTNADLADLVAEQAIPPAVIGADAAVAGFVSSPSSATSTALSATYAGKCDPTDAVLYVSRSSKASDSNDGLSLGKAKATVAGAIAALPTTGGLIQLAVGTWLEEVDLRNKSNVKLQGVGPATEIRRPAGGAAPGVVMVGGTSDMIEVSHLTIDGNKTLSGTGGAGYYFYDAGATSDGGLGGTSLRPSGRLNPQHSLHDVYIRNTKGNGVTLDGTTGFGGGNFYHNIWVYHADGHSFAVAQPDNMFSNCDSGQAGLTGFYDTAGFNKYHGCKSWSSGRVTAGGENGLGFRSSYNNLYAACVAEANAGGGWSCFGRARVSIAGCFAERNVGIAFDLRSATDCNVHGVAWDTQTTISQTSALELNSSSTGNVISLTGNTPVPSTSFNTASNTVITPSKSTYGAGVTIDASTATVTTGRENDVATGETTFGRRDVQTTNVSLQAAGSVILTYFTAKKTETITQMRVISGSTAHVGATLIKFGLYEVASNGNLTLVASTASDTTLLSSAFTRYTKAFAASTAKTAGKRYAAAVLVVGATTLPTVQGRSAMDGNELLTVAPALAGRRIGQTDLPASMLSTDVVNSNGAEVYAALLP